MKTESVTYLIITLFLFSSPVAELSGEDRTEQPNIIFFLVDDLGWQDTSVSFLNQPCEFQQHFRTPNVAELASKGMRFSRAYSCCVCTPTRISIMTGQNSARHGSTNWIFNANQETSGQTNRLLPPQSWNRVGLKPDQMTLAKLLRSAGYHTIHCGKAHWGAEGTPGADPKQLGFDVNIAGHHAGAPGSYQGTDGFGAARDRPGRNKWAVPGLQKYHGTKIHLTDALAVEACRSIEESVKAGKPFFLHMATYAVHTPIQEHGRFISRYRGRLYANGNRIPDVEARYSSMVEGFDDALGQVLAKTKELGQSSNTIVVFTSDNGGLSAHSRKMTPRGTGRNTHCWPLREGKGSAYEGGIRVPLLVSWAEIADSSLQRSIPISAGCCSNFLVSCEDYFPTICHWAGIEDIQQQSQQLAGSNTVADRAIAIDGRDFTKALHGEVDVDNRSLFFHYPHVWGPVGSGYQPHSSLISGDWKLIYFYHSRRWEMYDLQDDIGESRNLLVTERNNESVNAKFKSLQTVFRREFARCSAQPPVVKGGIEYLRQSFGNSNRIYPIASTENRGQLAGWGAGRSWLDQHADINRIAKDGSVDLVFLGDSITQGWGGPGRQVAATAPKVWEKFYAGRNAANFGISGDGFRNLLWRIEHGNLDGLAPKLIVLQIGTNDLAHDEPEVIAEGIEQVVLRIEELRKKTKVLLVGIFPRGERPNDPMWLKAKRVNQLLTSIADDRKTFFVDLSEKMLDDRKLLLASHFRRDKLHLTPAGYQAWASGIEPFVAKVLGNKK